MVKSLGEVSDVPNAVEGANINKDDSEAYIGAGFDLNDIIKPEESKSRCGKIFSPEKLMAKSKVDALKPWIPDEGLGKKNDKVSHNITFWFYNDYIILQKGWTSDKHQDVKIDLNTVNISMAGGNSGV